MKIIDKYLIKQYIQTILFGLIAFVFLFLIINLMEQLDDFIDHDVPFDIVLQFYFVFTPEILRLMLPIAVLLAALFVTGKLSNQNELTAMKSSGVSLYRYMIPFLITTFIISLFAVFFGGYVVPLANHKRINIEREYMNRSVIRTGSNIFFQDSKTRIVSISSYNITMEQANRISIQDFDENDITKMRYRIDAAKMKYDTSNGSWNLSRGTERSFSDSTEIMKSFNNLILTDLRFTPDDIIKKQIRSDEMTLPELEELAKEQLATGNDSTRIDIEYHSRFAFAFASVITVMFGLPLSANRRRGGLAVQFGISLLVTFIYLVFMSISQSFGKNGVMNPVLTAWFANIVFFVAAVINLIRVRK